MKKILSVKDEGEEFNREGIKVYGYKRILNSFKYSMNGLTYAYRYEQSFWIHAFFTGIAIILGIALKIKLSEWAIIFIALGITLALELINTAIEAAVDLTTSKIHPLAKIAKDCGSAATFVMSLVSVIISLFVFGPYIKILFGII
ncbi:MAG: diacylglycerol kinase [Firmicutes bacterium]|nr:diacylglycerol kinase [Bacillota bacterium]